MNYRVTMEKQKERQTLEVTIEPAGDPVKDNGAAIRAARVKAGEGWEPLLVERV